MVVTNSAENAVKNVTTLFILDFFPRRRHTQVAGQQPAATKHARLGTHRQTNAA